MNDIFTLLQRLEFETHTPTIEARVTRDVNGLLLPSLVQDEVEIPVTSRSDTLEISRIEL